MGIYTVQGKGLSMDKQTKQDHAVREALGIPPEGIPSLGIPPVDRDRLAKEIQKSFMAMTAKVTHGEE